LLPKIRLFISKAGDNPQLLDLLSRANMNKVLQEIADKDKTHYRIFNQILGPFSETNTSYYKSSVGGYHAVKLRRYDDLSIIIFTVKILQNLLKFLIF
jgi:hypothetical protein